MFNNWPKIASYFFLFLAVFIASVTYKSYKNTSSRYFLFFLWFTMLIELFGLARYYYYTNIQSNLYSVKFISSILTSKILHEEYFKQITWIYNLYRFVIFPFYIFFYLTLVSEKRKKKQILIILFICITISIIDLIINRNVFISEKLMITRISGGFFIFISASIYLMEILKSDKLLTFHKTLPFWITFGALIFYLTTIPIFIFKDYLFQSNLSIYSIILYISNYFLYGCFIIGFILNAIEYNKNKRDIRLKI